MAVVEDRDKRGSQDQILTTPVKMTNDYTRDLINKFMAVEAVEAERGYYMPVPTARLVQPQQQRLDAEKIDCVEENYELSLGLSSNGRFGFDPNAKKIKRAASIPESSMIPSVANGSGAGSLIRTCSLPVVRPAESREEWLRRKELQSQRRMEARRRKNEKRRQSRTARERSSGSQERGVGTETTGGENSNNNNPVEQAADASAADGLIRTTSLARRVGGMVLNREIDQVVPISPPTSGGSTGGSSSGTTESGVQPRQGTIPMDVENSNSRNIAGPQNKTKVVNFLEGSSSSKIVGPQNKTKTVTFLEDSSSNKIFGFPNKPKRSPLDDMPSVITRGIGPNGKRVEGFLYKYGKGRKSVKIVCVCHGSFLTPAEFVKHAGGGDVPNPLQEIIVNSSAS